MIAFDAHLSIGAWPFRSHATRTAAQLVARLDALGIGGGLCGSLHGVFYRDSQRANEDLLAELEPFRDRLVPAATINPTYARWEAELDACAAAGCRAVRLYPNYHDYQLGDRLGQQAIAAAAERGLVLCFVQRHEDRRQKHRLDPADDLNLAELAAALDPQPAAKVAILNGLGYLGTPFVTEPKWRERRLVLDLSREDGVLRKSIPALLDAVGAEQLTMGTGLPLRGPQNALLKLSLMPAAAQTEVGGHAVRRLLEPGAS